MTDVTQTNTDGSAPSPVLATATSAADESAAPTASAAGNETPAKPPRWLRRAIDVSTFTPAQRRAMVVPLVLVLAVIGWRMALHRVFVSDPQPPEPARFADLQTTLDPNTATWEELVALPQLGEKRARAIVAYREERLQRRPGRPAFEDAYDLAAVKGLGASMIELLRPHLRFPDPASPISATSRPAGE